MQGLAEALEHAESAGYREHFDVRGDKLTCETAEFDVEHVTLVDTVSVDSGTDPGDDVTIYLLRTDTGVLGHLVVPDSFHVGAARARVVDRLLHERSSGSAPGKRP